MYQQIWKDIPTWEGIYQVSNFGRIKRLKGGRVKQDQIYLGKDAGNGYYRFVLTYGKRKERWDVHRLVASVWHRCLQNNEDVHHKNEFKFCNCCWNIEIKTHSKHSEEHKKGRVNTEVQNQKIRQAKIQYWKQRRKA